MIIDRSDKFKKDIKKLNNPIAKVRLDKVIKAMFNSPNGNLNNMFGDHQLLGDLKEFRELHLDANCLLVYKIYKDFILLDGIYTHKELDKKKASLTIFSNLQNFSNLLLFLRN